MSNDRIAGIVLAIFGVVVAFESRSYPLGTIEDPGPAYLPLVLSVLLVAFGAIVAVRGGRGTRFTLGQFAGIGKVLAILAGMAFAALSIEPLGYRITIAMMLVYFFGVVERKHPVVTVVAAVVMAFGSHYLFATLLKVPLPVGPGSF